MTKWDPYMELVDRAVDENGGPGKYRVKDVYDSLKKVWPKTAFELDYNKVNSKPVSYTHLTLPTILLV